MYKFEDVFTSSDEYASRFSGEIGNWLLSVQDQTVLKCLDSVPSEGPLFLDVGGGHGQLEVVAKALNMSYLVLGSHIDAFSNLGRRTGQPLRQGAVSDLLNLPFKDKSIAIVASVRLLSHCEDWRKLIAEMCRICSGHIVIDYPPLLSSNLLYKLLFPVKKLLEGNTRTFTIFSHAEIEAAFRENGFRLKKRRGQFFWPMVLHRKLKSVSFSKRLEKLADSVALQQGFGNPAIAVFERS